jgi:hypothetical protein
MAELPAVPNLDPNAPAVEPAPVTAPETPAPAHKAVTDPVIRGRPAAASDKGARPVAAPVKPPASPPPDGPPSEVQDSVEEVLQHTSAQTLKLSHLEDVLAALNRTLTDLQDEMHAGFSELRAVTEQSVANAVGGRETAIRADRAPAAQNLELIEEQVVMFGKRQNLVLIIGAVQALLLAVTLIAVLTSRPSAPMPEPIETTTPSAAVSPTPAPPIGESLEPAGTNDDGKHKESKKKKGRHR